MILKPKIVFLFIHVNTVFNVLTRINEEIQRENLPF